uniref:CABIT domain-containing protein n=1 Tax=Trichuris muris TaxID=70415 RepID=A0A5S6Q7S9_TRIMR
MKVFNHSNAGVPSTLLTAVKWDVENASFLDEFVDRYPLPHVALVTKGQYLDVGLPNMANPMLKPYLLTYAKQTQLKIVGQVVKMKDNKPAGLSSLKVAIPMEYNGFFEILSEDGHAAKTLESVSELSEKCVDLCLVRQRCKAYLPNKDGELKNLCRSRAVLAGEILTVVGRFYLKSTQFLRCFDESGCSLFFKMRQKAKFSPIAKKNAISGVHTISNLAAKRLPLTARLIYGSCPNEMYKQSGSTQPVIRLQSTLREELLLAYCLQKAEGQFLTIPLNAHIKLAPAMNYPQMVVHPEFKELCNWCAKVVPSFLSGITLVNDEQLARSLTKEQNYPSDNESLDFPPESNDEEIDQLYDYIRGDFQRQEIAMKGRKFESGARYQGRPLLEPLTDDNRLPKEYKRSQRQMERERQHPRHSRLHSSPGIKRDNSSYHFNDPSIHFHSIPDCKSNDMVSRSYLASRSSNYSVSANRPQEWLDIDHKSCRAKPTRQSSQQTSRTRPKSLFIPETSPFFQCAVPPLHGDPPTATSLHNRAEYYNYRQPIPCYSNTYVPYMGSQFCAQPYPSMWLRQKFHFPGVYAYEL